MALDCAALALIWCSGQPWDQCPLTCTLWKLVCPLLSADYLSAIVEREADESVDIALQREAIALGALGEG